MMKMNTPCQQCWILTQELTGAWKAEMRSAKSATGTLAFDAPEMSAESWERMFENARQSSFAEIRRKAVQHELLTGHRIPFLPVRYLWPDL